MMPYAFWLNLCFGTICLVLALYELRWEVLRGTDHPVRRTLHLIWAILLGSAAYFLLGSILHGTLVG